jgi:hypothetical protein
LGVSGIIKHPLFHLISGSPNGKQQQAKSNKMNNDFKIDFLMLSHGRQGTFSLFSVLNIHPEIFVPCFDHVDDALLKGDMQGIVAPDLGKNSYQSRFPRDLNLKNGLIHHSFNRLNLLPGKSINLLPNILNKKSVLFLFSRDPVDNFISSYNIYISLYFVYKYFKIFPRKHVQFSRPEPLNPKEYFDYSQYTLKYQHQLDLHKNFFSNICVFDFSAIYPEQYLATLDTLANHIGVKPFSSFLTQKNLPYNPGNDLLLQRVFAFKNKMKMDIYEFEIGLFHIKCDRYTRGSFEVELFNSGIKSPNELAFFASTHTWFGLPLKYRDSILQGRDPNKSFERTIEKYVNYIEFVKSNSRKWVISKKQDDLKNIFCKNVINDCINFCMAYPHATISWKSFRDIFLNSKQYVT